MKNIFLISVIFLTLVSFNKLVSADVPTIVISAGKTPQSLSTVGTNVTVISGDTIRNSNEIFLGNKSHVWQQALNRVHVQKSILLYCFGKLR